MRVLSIIMISMLMTACGNIEVTSYPVTPSDIKVAEDVCGSNGGMSGIFVTTKSRIDNQYIQINCNNGVNASIKRGK